MKILNHDIQSKMGNMIKECVVLNKLEDINSLLKYTDDDFTPTGNLCYINENGEKLNKKLIKEFFNLRWFIQHLIDENEYQYDDNEWTNPLSESNWTYQTNKTFIKYVNFTLKEKTPEQLKQNTITVHPNQKLDKGESIEEEEKSTTSSDKLEHDSESDITTEDEEETNTTEKHQVHNVLNETIHDEENSSQKIDNLIHHEYNTSENENTIEIETFEQYGEKFHETEESIPTETSQVLTVFNKAIHHKDDSSDDKSEIEIEPPKENGEQEIGKQDKLLTTKFQMEIENRKVEGLITYSTEQQVFKFKVNSSWGVNIEFTLYELKWTIHAILQHEGFIIQQRIHVS